MDGNVWYEDWTKVLCMQSGQLIQYFMQMQKELTHFACSICIKIVI